MTKKIISLLSISLVTVLTLFSFWFFFLRNSEESKLFEQANQVIFEIENFKRANDRLPTSLEEVGIKETEEGPFFYEKRGELDYAIFYSIGFDEVWAYYSDTQQWENTYR